MYYNLLGALKRRLIHELKDIFASHPEYDKAVPNIQNKYSFEERPQFAIIVKGSGGNRIPLSASDYVGRVVSHTMLAYYGEPKFPIEWVREDTGAIEANGKVFPSLPGVYYLEILKAPTNVNEPGQFIIDPLLTITQELVRVFDSGVEKMAKLDRKPVKGTVRLYENAYFMLTEGTDYTIDYKTGYVTFLATFSPKETVIAGYRTAAPSIGPVDYWWNQSDTKTIPGVVLAFGKRGRVGDKVAVVVYDDRRDCAEAYGGKFEFNFDLDIIAQDPTQAEEMCDFAVMGLLAKRLYLGAEGLEIPEITPGGEAEEQKDETADIFFYTTPLSVQLRGDWEVHIPLALTLSKASATKSDGTSGLKMMASNLALSTLPVVTGRNNDYERIG